MKRSLHALNLTQFFGALNDNVFKLILIYMAIDLEGKEAASSVLALAGATFVAPFLLFSSLAGIIADRVSKTEIIVSSKKVEIAIALFAIPVFYFQLKGFGYLLLFAIAAQSAFFGPAKFGIIPEIVEEKKIAKANGLITAFTYLAIIIGTFLASFTLQISGRNYTLGATLCLAIALAGYLSSKGVEKTAAKWPGKGLSMRFVSEVAIALKDARKESHLLSSMLGAAFFLFIGAFTQLNIIPFAMNALHLSDIAGGYLFLATACGIAAGASVAGRVFERKTELAIPCIAGLFLSALFFLIGSFSHHLYAIIAFLFLLGVAGGFFIVPFDTYIQLKASDSKRGTILGATNFLSFCGVALASLMLVFFSKVLFLNAAGGFIAMGILTLAVSILFILRFADRTFSYIARKFYKKLYTLEKEGEITLPHLFTLEKATWTKLFLLLSEFPQTQFLIPTTSRKVHAFFRFLTSFHPLAEGTSLSQMSMLGEGPLCVIGEAFELDTVCIIRKRRFQALMAIKTRR